MTYYQILKAAKAANASENQIALIEQLRDVMSQLLKTYNGTPREPRDVFVRNRLERWLTAIQVGYRQGEFWQDVLDQVAK
jgi:hypothetical protein